MGASEIVSTVEKFVLENDCLLLFRKVKGVWFVDHSRGRSDGHKISDYLVWRKLVSTSDGILQEYVESPPGRHETF